MENFFDLMFYLKRECFIQEEILLNLRELKTNWKVENEITEELQEDVGEQPLAAVTNSIQTNEDEFYDQIEQLLTKARESINQDYTKMGKKLIKKETADDNTKSEEPKLKLEDTKKIAANIKSKTLLTKSSSMIQVKPPVKKKQPTQVFVNAPYKTDPIKTNLKPRPIINTVRKSSSSNFLHEEKLTTITKLPSQPNLFKESNDVVKKPNSQIQELNSIPVIKHIEPPEPKVQIKQALKTSQVVNLKEISTKLFLPSKVENLLIKNSDLTCRIVDLRSKSGRSVMSRKSFLSRVDKLSSETSDTNSSYSSLFRLQVIFQKTERLLMNHVTNLRIPPTLDKENKHLLYLKLKTLSLYLNNSSQNLKKFLYKELEAFSEFKFKQNEIDDDDGFLVFLTNETMDIGLKHLLPVSYQNENELKKIAQLHCDLIQVEAKYYLLKFISKTYLNEKFFNKNFQINKNLFAQTLNLVFNLVSDKRMVIAM